MISFGLCSSARRVELVVVDPLVVLADAVGDDRVELAGEVQRMAVGEVAAVREVHPEDGVARLEHGEAHAHVGLGAGVRLHVGVLGPEERLGARDRERLDDVHVLAAAVVALAGIAFRVLVGQHRAGRLEHGGAHEILGGDEFDAVRLPLGLVADGCRDVGVRLRERLLHEGESAGCHMKDQFYGGSLPPIFRFDESCPRGRRGARPRTRSAGRCGRSLARGTRA